MENDTITELKNKVLDPFETGENRLQAIAQLGAIKTLAAQTALQAITESLHKGSSKDGQVHDANRDLRNIGRPAVMQLQPVAGDTSTFSRLMHAIDSDNIFVALAAPERLIELVQHNQLTITAEQQEQFLRTMEDIARTSEVTNNRINALSVISDVKRMPNKNFAVTELLTEFARSASPPEVQLHAIKLLIERSSIISPTEKRHVHDNLSLILHQGQREEIAHWAAIAAAATTPSSDELNEKAFATIVDLLQGSILSHYDPQTIVDLMDPLFQALGKLTDTKVVQLAGELTDCKVAGIRNLALTLLEHHAEQLGSRFEQNTLAQQLLQKGIVQRKSPSYLSAIYEFKASLHAVEMLAGIKQPAKVIGSKSKASAECSQSLDRALVRIVNDDVTDDTRHLAARLLVDLAQKTRISKNTNLGKALAYAYCLENPQNAYVRLQKNTWREIRELDAQKLAMTADPLVNFVLLNSRMLPDKSALIDKEKGNQLIESISLARSSQRSDDQQAELLRGVNHTPETNTSQLLHASCAEAAQLNIDLKSSRKSWTERFAQSSLGEAVNEVGNVMTSSVHWRDGRPRLQRRQSVPAEADPSTNVTSLIDLPSNYTEQVSTKAHEQSQSVGRQ